MCGHKLNDNKFGQHTAVNDCEPVDSVDIADAWPISSAIYEANTRTFRGGIPRSRLLYLYSCYRNLRDIFFTANALSNMCCVGCFDRSVCVTQEWFAEKPISK